MWSSRSSKKAVQVIITEFKERLHTLHKLNLKTLWIFIKHRNIFFDDRAITTNVFWLYRIGIPNSPFYCFGHIFETPTLHF